MVINDPIDHRQYAAFGHKDENGSLDTIYRVAERLPDVDEWMLHEFDKEFLPAKTTTSTGHTIEYKNIDKGSKTGTVVVKETASGTVLWQQDNLPLSDDFENVHDEAQNTMKSGGMNQRNKKRKWPTWVRKWQPAQLALRAYQWEPRRWLRP